MNRTSTFLLLAAVLGWVPACGDHGRSRDGEAAHARDRHEASSGRPTIAVTHWTDRTELFMEYPVFVAGESGRSAIHVTDLADFSPLSVGEVILDLRGEDGQVVQFRTGPSGPGIFGLDLQVERPGLYDVTLRIDAPDLQDVHEVGRIRVHAPGETWSARTGEEEAIPFLKEQQWMLEFGTVVAAARGIRPGFTVPATVTPRPGGDALLTAPVPGRIDPTTDVPVPGATVRARTVLVRIAPRSEDVRDAAGLRASLIEAEQAHLLAVQERDRAARLVEARALPQRRLDEAEAARTATEARLEAARERWSRFEALSESSSESGAGPTFSLRAPFDGVVSDVRITAGASVEVDEPLMRVVALDRVHLVGSVPERLASILEKVSMGELAPDAEAPVRLGRPVAIHPVIDPVARTAEIRFDLDNRAARFRIGQAVQLRLMVGDEAVRTAIPESAVVEDGGRPVVFVQTAGESFEKRPVRLGDAAAGWVHVTEGVAPGERVVHRGAYLIRLSAMSTQIPAHGHVH